jgi:hypothetical protein
LARFLQALPGHPSCAEPLSLVKARVKKGVMSLIPNDPVSAEAQHGGPFPLGGAGRSKHVVALPHASWLSNARASGRSKLASSCLAWSCSSTPSSFLCLIPSIMNSYKHSCVSTVTEPESGARILQHRWWEHYGTRWHPDGWHPIGVPPPARRLRRASTRGSSSIPIKISLPLELPKSMVHPRPKRLGTNTARDRRDCCKRSLHASTGHHRGK